jgi:hypothetical protein
MNVFPLIVALLPLTTYFLLMGVLRIIRPLVTTSTRDGMAIAIAVSGLVMIGPMQLLFPSQAAAVMGWIVWLILATLYVLCVSLVLLSLRPKIIVYGVSPAELLTPLLEACQTVDESATLDSGRQQVTLHRQGVLLRVEALGGTDAAQIEAFENNLHPKFWQHLLVELRRGTSRVKTRFSVGGLGMVVIGLALGGVIVSQIVSQPDEVLAGFRQWLQL